MGHIGDAGAGPPDAEGAGTLAILARYGSLSLALLMIQVDNLALVVALPAIAEDLRDTTTDVNWAIGAYMIAFGVALIPGGRLGDLWGRKRTMMAGLAGFVVASVIAGLADSTAELVSWRILQGLAGGVYSPLALSLVSTTVDPARRGRVLGAVMAAAAVGTAAGPVVGGLVTASLGWRWVLLVNLPIGVAAMGWGLTQLPESRDEAAAARGLRGFDWPGTGLVAVGVTALALAVELADRQGLTLPVVGAGAAGVCILGLFVAWERRARWPLVPLSIWQRREMRWLVVTCTVVYMALMVVFFVASVDAQDIRGLAPWLVGFLFVPAAMGRMAASLIAGRLASRGTGLGVMSWSMLVGALTVGVLAVAGSLWLFVVALTAVALALGIGHQFGVVDVQVRVSGEHSSAAAGVVFTTLMLAGGLSVAVTATAMELVSGGLPTAGGVTTVLLGWSALLGACGAVCTAWLRWRHG